MTHVRILNPTVVNELYKRQNTTQRRQAKSFSFEETESLSSYSEHNRFKDSLSFVYSRFAMLIDYDLNYFEKKIISDKEQFIYKCKIKLSEVLTTLKIEHKEKLVSFLEEFLEKLYELDITNIQISRTGDNELVIYTETDEWIKNLIFDEDLDVEFLFIDKKDRKNSYNKIFYFEDNIDINGIASLL